MTYEEAIDWLLSFADFERTGRFQNRPDVAPMLALLERLGNPHVRRDGVRITVHIAGSKGKGSVAAMVESILCSYPLRVGLYTSPHLHSYCERIRFCKYPIPEDGFARLIEEQLRPAVVGVQQSLAGRQFVTFDLLTALAFIAFREVGVLVQVVEVGLGGRLDSTNVFDSKDVAVVTPISLEHTAVLGDTVEQIAREKAGIITPSCNVIMAPQAHPEAEAIIREHSERLGSPVLDVARDYRWEKLAHDVTGQDILVEHPEGVLRARLSLLGAHQIENAVTAIACVQRIPRFIYDPDDQTIGNGLATIDWPCRIEVLRERPLVIADGAHNRDSARRLRETLVDYFACDRAFFIVGCGSDKDIDGLAEELAPLASRVIAVRADHPRAMAPQLIAEAFGKRNIDTETADGVAGALERAMAATGESGLICVSGSLFVAAEARAHVLGLPAGR